MKNVLKMLGAISIFLSSSAFPVSSFAILHEDRGKSSSESSGVGDYINGTNPGSFRKIR